MTPIVSVHRRPEEKPDRLVRLFAEPSLLGCFQPCHSCDLELRKSIKNQASVAAMERSLAAKDQAVEDMKVELQRWDAVIVYREVARSKLKK